MSTDAVAVLGFVALFALMLLRVPVGMAMGLVGVSGFGYLVGFSPALKQNKYMPATPIAKAAQLENFGILFSANSIAKTVPTRKSEI